MSGRFKRLQGMPPIMALMTPFPYSIESSEPVEAAASMMRQHGIRHLAVKNGERLVGVISDREVALAEPASEIRRVAGMAYVVDLTTPADRVLATMAERHLGAALIVKEGRLAGIFTATDVSAAFAELLRTLFPAGGGEVA